MPREENYSGLLRQIVLDRLVPKNILPHADGNLFVLDRGWYCILVEFQNSQWSNGIYLKIGVDLNFYPRDYFLFGYVKKETNFTVFSDEKQLGEILHSLCDMALWEVNVLDQKFKDLLTAKRTLDAGIDVWSYYEKGILTALTGNFEKARNYIRKKVSPRSYDSEKWELVGFAKDMLTWMDDEAHFAQHTINLVNKCRELKKMPFFGHPQLNLIYRKKNSSLLSTLKKLFSFAKNKR